MANNESDKIIIPLEADVTSLLKDLAKAGTSAAKTEGDIDSLLKKLKELSSAGGSNIVINVSADISSAEAKIRGLDSVATDVDVLVYADTSQAESDIENVADNVPSPVVQVVADTATAESDIENVADNIPSPEVVITADTSELDRASSEISSIDGASPKVTVDVDSSDLADIKTELAAIRQVATIDLVLNTAGAVTAAAKFVADFPIVGAMNDTAAAVRKVEGQTNQTFDNLGKVINNVYADGFAESRDQIAGVITQLEQAGIATSDLESSTRSAFNTAASTGQDVNEVLKVQERLVSSGLADSYTEAGDIITTGFQTGANRGGDLLDTLYEYSIVFAQLGLDAGTVLGTINQGLDQGVYNSDRWADTWKELGIQITAAIGSGEGAAWDAIQQLGIQDSALAFSQGKITGAEFASGAIEAAKEQGAKGDFSLISLFGTPLEDVTTTVLKGIDLSAAGAEIITPGAAQDAANTINDHLGASVESLALTVETRLGEAFTIAGQPLTELLDGAKDKVDELTRRLQSGEGIPEAIEATLAIPGFTDAVDDFQSGVGNLIIGFELALASILDVLGKGDAANAVRADAEARVLTQTQFDLMNADDQAEVSKIIQSAIDRGVDASALSTGITNVTGELISQGDVDRAQEIVWAVNALPNAFVQASEGFGEGVRNIPLSINPEATPEEIEAAKQKALADFQAETGTQLTWTGDVKFIPNAVDVDTGAAQTAINDAITMIDNGMLNFGKVADIVTAPFTEALKHAATHSFQFMLDNPPTIPELPDFGAQLPSGLVEVNPIESMLGDDVVTAAIQSTTDISNATTAMADTATTDFDTVSTAAEDAAVGVDTVVVAADNLEVVGGPKMLAFAEIANRASQIATSGWQNFNAVLAQAQSAAGAGAGIPAGDGSLGGAIDWLTATVDSLEGKEWGGTVYANTPYEVGEKGPELFIPQTDGSIINAVDTAMIMEALNMIATMPAGSASNVVNNNWNMGGISQNLHTQSTAQSVSAADALARQIRNIR